jgi:hypothetical protein
MIAKNYRIYRIFNNIFITRSIITDAHLIRSVVAIVGIDMVINISNTSALYIYLYIYRSS